MHENYTDKLTELPRGKKALQNKWVYKLKPGESGKPPRYKTKIVVKGFQQKKSVDFIDIFTLVVKMKSIPAVLSIAANMDLEVEQLDVKTTVLHGDLEEEIYMHQSEGFVEKVKENLVCPFRKILYGLKKSTSAMVPKIRILHYRQRVPQNAGRLLHVCEELRRRRSSHTPVVRR